MFAVVPLDSSFSSWPVWLVLAVWLGLASLFGIAVLFAWARWGDGWDRLREHSVPVSAAILLLIAGVTAWRWWSESSDRNRLTVESSSSTPSGAVEAVQPAASGTKERLHHVHVERALVWQTIVQL